MHLPLAGSNVALEGAQVTNALDQLCDVLRIREDQLRVHFYHVSIALLTPRTHNAHTHAHKHTRAHTQYVLA